MKWLIVTVLGLIGFIGGIINLFVLPESNLVLATGGFVSSIGGMGIIGHHKIRENKQKAAADRERERIDAEAETIRLEDGLELLQGKDWAAEVTIDKINKELGLERDPAALAAEAAEAEYYGGTIAACAITGDEIEIVNSDGDVVAKYPEPEDATLCADCGDHHDEWMGCLPHALNVIHKFVDNKESDERLSPQKPQTATEMVDEVAGRIAAERAELATDNMRTREEESAVSIIDLGLLLAETEAKVNVLKDRINKDLW